MAQDTRSSAEIEQDLERQRSMIAATIDEIQARFAPERLMDNGIGWLRGPGGQELLRVLRRHPVPTAIAAIGITWLLLEARRTPRLEPVPHDHALVPQDEAPPAPAPGTMPPELRAGPGVV
jgi:hypothetical protein